MYNAGASGSPCTGLGQVLSAPSSASISAHEASSDLFKFQSIEDHTRRGHDKFYQLHLKDKARFKELKYNENNLIAGTWLFHQFLDALNVDEGVPLLALRFLSKAGERDATRDGRVRVVVQVEFFDGIAEDQIKGNFKQGTVRVGELVWETAVWVQDAGVFEECVRWKERDTRRKWEEYRERLESV